MRITLLISFAMLFGQVFADEEYIPELRNLFSADLVLDATVKSQDKDQFYIIVNKAIIDKGYGLKKGDQINLPREHDGCGFEVDYMYYKRSRFYLIKKEKGWRLNFGSTQSIKSVYHFGNLSVDDSFCGLSFVPPQGKERETMNATIREFERAYAWDEDKYEYIPRLDSIRLKQLAEKNIMVSAFEEKGRCCIDGDVEEPVEIEFESERPEEDGEIQACALTGFEPEPPFTDEEMREYLVNNENPLTEHGIEGKVIVRFTITDSGRVEDVSVLRGVHPVLDSLAVKKTYKMPNWQPARNNYGKNFSCFTILPFSYRLEELK